MHRFIGYRPSPPEYYHERGTAAPPDEPQYEGVVFTDGSVALRWRTAFRSSSVWDSFFDFFHVHGHPEYGTRIEWLDGPAPGAEEIIAVHTAEVAARQAMEVGP